MKPEYYISILHPQFIYSVDHTNQTVTSMKFGYTLIYADFMISVPDYFIQMTEEEIFLWKI